MTTIPHARLLSQLRLEAERTVPDFLRDLERLVNIESGSYSKAGSDRVVDWMEREFVGLGAAIARHPHDDLGDTLVATFEGRPGGPTVMLIGHADTVFDDGFLARRPFEIDGDGVMGPGASDMKSGLLLGLYALRAIRELAPERADRLPTGRLVYVVNSDEEIGSPNSTPVIETLARDADAAFVLEPARANGDIVSARKSMMHAHVAISGIAAHAGVEPEKGRNAVLEAAHKTVALHDLNGRWPTVTVNVGRVSGGSRPNIVPDEAEMLVDVRAATLDEHEQALSAVHDILATSSVEGVTTRVQTRARHLPMEKTAASARLIEQAVSIAATLGFALGDSATGGSSDANTTSGVGVPSLDGLGPVGSDNHTDHERIRIDSIAPRLALLAGLLLAQAQPGDADYAGTRTNAGTRSRIGRRR